MKQITFLTDNLAEPGEVYHAVERAAADNDAKVRTIDRFSVEESVLHRLWSLLETSDLIIANITRNSPNIIYEIGLAHGLGKPVLILTNEASIRLPPDLRGQFIIDYRTDGERLDILKFTLSKLIPSALEENGTLGPLRGPRQAEINPSISEQPIISEFGEILTVNGVIRRHQQLEDWFFELTAGVAGWEVLRATEETREYDLVVWNSSSDSELTLLENPIPIDLKASKTGAKTLETISSKAMIQGFSGLIVGTTSRTTKRNEKLVKDLFAKKNFLLILLDCDALLPIKSPKDFVEQLKTKILHLVYEVDP